MFGVFIGGAARKKGASGAGEASAAHQAVLQGAPATVFFRSLRRAPQRRPRHRVRRRSASGFVMERAVRIALCVIYALAFVWAVLFILS